MSETMTKAQNDWQETFNALAAEVGGADKPLSPMMR